MALWENGGKIVLGGGGSPSECAYCPCDTCAPYHSSDIVMTYAGFTDAGHPFYTESTSPNGDYTCPWNGSYWEGTPVLLGVWDNGVDPPETIYLEPACQCADFGAGPVFNIVGAGATLGYNYNSVPLGTPTSTGTGSDPIYDPGTIEYNLAP